MMTTGFLDDEGARGRKTGVTFPSGLERDRDGLIAPEAFTAAVEEEDRRRQRMSFAPQPPPAQQQGNYNDSDDEDEDGADEDDYWDRMLAAEREQDEGFDQTTVSAAADSSILSDEPSFADFKPQDNRRESLFQRRSIQPTSTISRHSPPQQQAEAKLVFAPSSELARTPHPHASPEPIPSSSPERNVTSDVEMGEYNAPQSLSPELGNRDISQDLDESTQPPAAIAFEGTDMWTPNPTRLSTNSNTNEPNEMPALGESSQDMLTPSQQRLLSSLPGSSNPAASSQNLAGRVAASPNRSPATTLAAANRRRTMLPDMMESVPPERRVSASHLLQNKKVDPAPKLRANVTDLNATAAMESLHTGAYDPPMAQVPSPITPRTDTSERFGGLLLDDAPRDLAQRRQTIHARQRRAPPTAAASARSPLRAGQSTITSQPTPRYQETIQRLRANRVLMQERAAIARQPSLSQEVLRSESSNEAAKSLQLSASQPDPVIHPDQDHPDHEDNQQSKIPISSGRADKKILSRGADQKPFTAAHERIHDTREQRIHQNLETTKAMSDILPLAGGLPGAHKPLPRMANSGDGEARPARKLMISPNRDESPALNIADESPHSPMAKNALHVSTPQAVETVNLVSPNQPPAVSPIIEVELPSPNHSAPASKRFESPAPRTRRQRTASPVSPPRRTSPRKLSPNKTRMTESSPTQKIIASRMPKVPSPTPTASKDKKSPIPSPQPESESDDEPTNVGHSTDADEDDVNKNRRITLRARREDGGAVTKRQAKLLRQEQNQPLPSTAPSKETKLSADEQDFVSPAPITRRKRGIKASAQQPSEPSPVREPALVSEELPPTEQSRSTPTPAPTKRVYTRRTPRITHEIEPQQQNRKSPSPERSLSPPQFDFMPPSPPPALDFEAPMHEDYPQHESPQPEADMDVDNINQDAPPLSPLNAANEQQQQTRDSTSEDENQQESRNQQKRRPVRTKAPALPKGGKPRAKRTVAPPPPSTPRATRIDTAPDGKRIQVEELPTPTVSETGRPRRNRIKPVEWWKAGEKKVYKKGILVAVQHVVDDEISSGSTHRKRKADGDPSTNAKRLTKRAKNKRPVPDIIPEELPKQDLEVGPHLPVIDSTTMGEIDSAVLFDPSIFELQDVRGAEYKFERLYSEAEFFNVGVMELPAGASKPNRGTKENCFAFVCMRGKVEVRLHTSSFEVVPGRIFIVPRCNQYELHNPSSDHSAILYFFSGRPVPPEIKNEDVNQGSAQYQSQEVPVLSVSPPKTTKPAAKHREATTTKEKNRRR